MQGERASNAAANLKAGEQRAREMQVEIETVRLLRQDVVSCYRREGVNHYKNCRKEVDAYVECISDPNLLSPKQRIFRHGPGDPNATQAEDPE